MVIIDLLTVRRLLRFGVSPGQVPPGDDARQDSKSLVEVFAFIDDAGINVFHVPD
jgi:hypothetical protein